VIQEETMKDKETKHRSEKAGFVAIWGKSVKRTDLYDDNVTPKKATRKTLPKFPLKKTMIYVKTTKFNLNVVDKLYDLRQALKKRSPRGYCEKQVNSMTKVSNRKICGGRTNRNIGFYVSTVFPVAVDNTKYCFHVPMDLNYGGISMLDGKIMKQTRKDVYKYGRLDTKLLDFCTTLSAGNHILEVYGAESCCDGTTRWTFQVNGGKWQDFTKSNLDVQMRAPAVEGDTIIEYGDMNIQLLKKTDWTTVKIKGKFNRPVVIMGVPSFKGPHPMTIRVKNVKRSQF